MSEGVPMQLPEGWGERPNIVPASNLTSRLRNGNDAQ
jgi:hypothetical protein